MKRIIIAILLLASCSKEPAQKTYLIRVSNASIYVNGTMYYGNEKLVEVKEGEPVIIKAESYYNMKPTLRITREGMTVFYEYGYTNQKITTTLSYEQ